jgi:hypothetical protein
MTAKKTFIVRCREFGRGPIDVHRFATLADASQYIRDRWQGADYIDGPASFHTDYCTYQLSGFALDDIGTHKWCACELDDGIDYGWMDWQWVDLSASKGGQR